MSHRDLENRRMSRKGKLSVDKFSKYERVVSNRGCEEKRRETLTQRYMKDTHSAWGRAELKEKGAKGKGDTRRERGY